MKSLNNKGFTLVEILAVIVILGVLCAITIPTVGTIIEKNNNDNVKNLEKTVLNAAKMYISDNRYQITLDNSVCSVTVTERDIIKINDVSLANASQIPIQTLIDNGYIKGKIVDPITKKDMNSDVNLSYVKVIYNCSIKDYKFEEVVIGY